MKVNGGRLRKCVKDSLAGLRVPKKSEQLVNNGTECSREDGEENMVYIYDETLLDIYI